MRVNLLHFLFINLLLNTSPCPTFYSMQSQTKPAVLCKSLKHLRTLQAATGVANEDHQNSGRRETRDVWAKERERHTAASSIWGRWCVQAHNKRQVWREDVCSLRQDCHLMAMTNWLSFLPTFLLEGLHFPTSILQCNSSPAWNEISAPWKGWEKTFWLVHSK